jgi:hypothetical protein
MTDAADNQWQIAPQGFFSRHYTLARGGQTVATLKMSLWKEGCEFTIAGHQFAIRRTSLWKDGFQLLAEEQPVCDVKRTFWSRRFELAAVGQKWFLQPAGWFSRTYQLVVGEHEVGTVRPAGWFTRRQIAQFGDDVPPPVQVLAIFLVLVIGQREHHSAAAGAGG